MVRYTLPPYYWKRTNARTVDDERCWGQGVSGQGVWTGYQSGFNNIPVPGAVEWDPFNRPDKILELRAGKNAIDYSWKCHEADSHKWVNIDQLVHWTPWTPDGPYQGGGRPKTQTLFAQNDPDKLSTYGLSQYHNSSGSTEGWYWDYTCPNWANMPIVPMAWFWKEMQQSIVLNAWPGADKPDFTCAGTEHEQYLYGPTQWFIKGIPLLGEDNRLISTSTMVAIKISLHLHAKIRESAIYAPTWGPFAWKQLYAHTKGNYIFQNSYVRYRTGGARRTWQNLDGESGTDAQKRHPRDPPYNESSQYPATNRPRIIEEETETQEDRNEIRITFSKEGGREQVQILPPERPIRRKTPIRDPSMKPIDTALMSDIQMG